MSISLTAGTGIGTSVWICATPQTIRLDQAGFEALTYVEISNLISDSKPSLSVQTGTAEQTYLIDGSTIKAKTTEQYPDVMLDFTPSWSDAGQDLLRSAGDTNNIYAVKVQKPLRSGETTPEIQYTTALFSVVSDKEQGGQDIDLQTTTMMPRQKFVRVEPT